VKGELVVTHCLNICRRRRGAAAALGLALVAGCSGGPSRIEPPSIDADDAAAEAMTLYDKNGDGAIADSELDAAPALKASMATLDKNADKKVQEDEIVQRIEAWQETGTGIVSLTCAVTLNGRPLEGAMVRFEPEPFLGEGLKAAEGETSPIGNTVVSIPKEQRPAPDAPPGVQLGFYKVRITKQVGGKESIPAMFNSETTLGQQIAPDDPALLKQNLRFDLKTN
jgi:hypothetical protein